jgi:hypothetical protein
MYCAYSNGSAFVGLHRYSASPSDAAGWNQPYRYKTLRFANVDADAALELCGRGASGIVCEK